MITEDRKKELAAKALAMRSYSYVPYSRFRVGAALLAKDGRIFTGCNIGNGAYTPSNCAERTAVFKAVSEGAREFEAIAIAGGTEGAEELDYCPPCGVCRQVLREFCSPDFPIYLVKSETEIREYTLAQLLPEGFGPEELGR